MQGDQQIASATGGKAVSAPSKTFHPRHLLQVWGIKTFALLQGVDQVNHRRVVGKLQARVFGVDAARYRIDPGFECGFQCDVHALPLGGLGAVFVDQAIDHHQNLERIARGHTGVEQLFELPSGLHGQLIAAFAVGILKLAQVLATQKQNGRPQGDFFNRHSGHADGAPADQGQRQASPQGVPNGWPEPGIGKKTHGASLGARARSRFDARQARRL